MSQSIIAGNPDFTKAIPKEPYLDIAEFFCDTIQGEGINIGAPAAFLRMKDCTQNCTWCDSREVWRKGNPYTFQELFDLMDQADLPRKLLAGQHLVLTGGSPLLQMKRLYDFIAGFERWYGFKPYIEVENECTINPVTYFLNRIDCWNNSPKLANSGNAKELRYNQKILVHLASLRNSWFKFVVTGEEDWEEIQKDFLNAGLIRRYQVILMPQGASREELTKNMPKVIEIAIRENVRYSSREHIMLWDKKTGV